jgi:hypothetical protein
MKRMAVFMLVVLPLAVLAAGCLPEASLRSELFLDDQSLISGEPCEAPCWNGITPGETTWNEAIEIINADETFEGFETNAEEGLRQAVWQKAGSGQYCCRIISVDQDDAPLMYTFLALAPDMIVDQVLETHGEPTYVTTFPFTSTESVVQMVYPEQLMVISILVGDSNSSLLANSEVVAVLYMSQSEMDTVLQTTELRAWAGYQAYSAYEQGTPVVTPSITLTPVPEE